MKQIVITRQGSPKKMEIEQRPDPTPAAGEVLVRVRASGVNFADLLTRQGIYPDAPKLPCVVGYEVAGIVEALGNGTSGHKIGDPVFALTRFGGYSDVVSVPATQVFPKPDSISFEQAAAIPVIYLTAYALLIVMGGLKPGESILIHNAGGGVGLAALDIAKHVGAATYGTSSPSKHAFLRDRGLDHPIDYRNADWLPVLLDLTEGKGVELVIDPLGGESWKKSYKALRPTGRLGVFGFSAAAGVGIKAKLGLVRAALQIPRFNPLAMMGVNKGVFGLNLGHLWQEREKLQQWMSEILDGVDQGWVRPYVSKAFPFEEAAAAHEFLESRRNIGKVMLVP
ncbi:MAG TPA: medium chain dehydrogenase/reductase family protein [Blastocatellia bacterium]